MRKDLRGNRYGRLIAMSVDRLNKQGESMWLCKCDCGSQVVVRSSALGNGTTASCGCLQRERAAAVAAQRKGIPLASKHRKPTVIDGVEHFKCTACGQLKPKADFYPNKRTPVGIVSQCKKCHVQSSIQRKDKEKARDANREYMRRAVAKDPEKFRARHRAASRNRAVTHRAVVRKLLNLAVRRGAVVKPIACSACGEIKKLCGHHDDYSKPLEVRWLCYECHGKEHRS